MNRAIFGGYQERFAVLGHTQVTADADGVFLPDLPNENRVRRIVLRSPDPFTFTLDGSDPAAITAMYSLADEVVTLDCDGTQVQLAGTAADIKIIYFGT